MPYYTEYSSPVGRLLLRSDGHALTGLWMDRQAPENGLPGGENPVLRQTCVWLDDYFAGRKPCVSMPVALEGTEFQRQVWQRLGEIPYGEVITYGDIARELETETGNRMSAQAVGGAVGRNPISIIIPCHRVVGAGGTLTGYAWGLERKQWLLRHEGWKGAKENDHQ